jgi:hypothetical protein
MSSQTDPLANWQPPQVNSQSDPFPDWKPPGPAQQIPTSVSLGQANAGPTSGATAPSWWDRASEAFKQSMPNAAAGVSNMIEHPIDTMNNLPWTIGKGISNTLKALGNLKDNPETAGNVAGQLPLALLGMEGGPSLEGAANTAKATSAVAKGAAKGAYQEMVAPGPSAFGYISKALKDVPGGNTLIKAIVGKYAGQAIGGMLGDAEVGGHVGTAVGLGTPIIKGAIRGGKEGLENYRFPGLTNPETKELLSRFKNWKP